MSKKNRDNSDDIYEEELEKIRNDMRDYRSRRERDKKDLLQFFIGLLMLSAGLFMIFQNLEVRSSWGTGLWHIGTYSLPNGLVFLPILVGIAMLFIMDRKIFGWIVLSIGIVVILAAVLMSTSIRWRTTNAYIFIIMFGLAVAGGSMVIRQLFKKD